MAYSSSSSTQNSYMYDVFLSFRGEDTRKNFVDHLYVALQRQGIHTYKDDKRLEKGKRIDHELLKSIEQSKCYIIVFSKNYAYSSWCLDELVKIMECQKTTQQIAYPVFYGVDPSEVRQQLGPVGEGFATHNNEREVGKWREAMKEAANLAGWDLRNTGDGHEAKLINKIVEKISLELRFINLEVDEKLVGMESRIKDIVSSLGAGVEDVRMIGIKGIGGGGKTTLARAVFDSIAFSFEGTSFIESVKEVSKPTMSRLRFLQKQVLSDVLNDKKITIGSVHEGKSKMRKVLCGKKVLLVLDDVDHLEQLEALAGRVNWFKPGSRIIITTRDEQVLVSHHVKWIHDVNLLSQEEAMCLFSRYAFGRDIPIQTYKELSLEVVHYAAGLPLTIRVLGSFLCGKDELEWIDALERLKTIPLKETLEKLELSYTCLEDDYKEIFLDVACLLKGWRKDDAIRALEISGFHARNGLRVLEQKSLITISRDKVLSMHDHIEEMGRSIVRRSHPDEPMRHSRLWIQREIEDVLANDLVNEVTRAIATNTFLWRRKNVQSSKILTKGFGNMKKLRFLHVVSETRNMFAIEVGQNFPNALRFLIWHGYPHCCLPKIFQANNLVALEMPYSRIEQLWQEGERKVLKNLRFLDFSYSRLTTLDCGLLPNLEKLNLEKCCQLVELHAPIGSLRRLAYLDLNHCTEFNAISFIEQLESLEVLENLTFVDFSCTSKYTTPKDPKRRPMPILSRVLKSQRVLDLSELPFSKKLFEELPPYIGRQPNLVSLDLNGCKNLKRLPQSIFTLRHLKDLDLESCAIEELPKDLGHLENLEWLNLGGTRIKHLPNTICMLKHLKTLLLAHCASLTKLPKYIGLLKSLQRLSLAYCEIRDIPISICNLEHLREFDLRYCYQLEELPQKLGYLKCLKVLNVEGTSISNLPQSISLLEDLEIIGFESRDSLRVAQNEFAPVCTRYDSEEHNVWQEPFRKNHYKRSRSEQLY